MADHACNIKFVQEVEKRPCLYNYMLSEYSRKDVTEKAWNEVGKAVNLQGYECKEKWKNLRTVFMRHIKAISDDSVKPRKPYYLADAMMFTLPFIKTASNYILPGQQIHHNACDEDEEDDSHFIQFKTEPTSESPPSSPQSSPPPSPPSVRQSNVSSKSLKNKRSKQDLEEVYVEDFKVKRNKMDDNIDEDLDANKMFLLSLLPDLDQMSLSQIRTFKRRVIDLIDDILQDNEKITRKSK